jgi:hypothetical protein
VLESVAERLPVPFTLGSDPLFLDLRLALGRRWLKLIAAPRPAFVARYPVEAPVVWLSVRRSTGRGQASSGLAFDRLTCSAAASGSSPPRPA